MTMAAASSRAPVLVHGDDQDDPIMAAMGRARRLPPASQERREHLIAMAEQARTPRWNFEEFMEKVARLRPNDE